MRNWDVSKLPGERIEKREREERGEERGKEKKIREVRGMIEEGEVSEALQTGSLRKRRRE